MKFIFVIFYLRLWIKLLILLYYDDKFICKTTGCLYRHQHKLGKPSDVRRFISTNEGDTARKNPLFPYKFIQIEETLGQLLTGLPRFLLKCHFLRRIPKTS